MVSELASYSLLCAPGSFAEGMPPSGAMRSVERTPICTPSAEKALICRKVLIQYGPYIVAWLSGFGLASRSGVP